MTKEADTMTLEQVTEEIRRLDPTLDPDKDAFKTAVVLLSSLAVGTGTASIAKFTGFERSYIEQLSRRLRRNGVWKGGQVHADWFDEETGSLAFWMDVLVAQGLVKRTEGK